MNKTLIKITAMTLILGMASIANAQNWSLSGNALSGISPLKLGSTDAEDVTFFTNDHFRMKTHFILEVLIPIVILQLIWRGFIKKTFKLIR